MALTACNGAAGRRMLLAGTVNVTVTSVISMPDGLTEAEVNTLTAGFAIAQFTGYQTGQFASLFGVTGVAVTQGTVYTTYPPEETSNSFVIGIAVGLGVGIPILIGLAVLAWWIVRKKKAASAVGPTQVHDEEAALGVAVADLPAEATAHPSGGSKVAPSVEPAFKAAPAPEPEEIPVATKPAKAVEEVSEPPKPSEPKAEQEEETAALNRAEQS
jgi:hypothetical protein